MSDAAAGEPQIAPLADGEERLLQTVHRADGETNYIYLARRRDDDDEVTGAGEPVNFVAIIRSTDTDPNDTAPPFSWQRGPDERSIYIRLAEAFFNAPPLPGSSHELESSVQWFVDRLHEANPGHKSPAAETANWAQRYVSLCNTVLANVNACAESMNLALGAREQIALHRNDGLPGTPIAIRNLTQMAERAELEFTSQYDGLVAAWDAARRTAAGYLETRGNHLLAEMQLAMIVDEDTLDNVATAKCLLAVEWGRTPEAFLQSLNRANALISEPSQGGGNIYWPSGSDAAL
jgi:hypothetical protein